MRFVVGRWLRPFVRRPVVCLPLLGWGVLTAIVYFMMPIAPLERFRPPPLEVGRPNNWRRNFVERVVLGNSADGTVLVTADERVFRMANGWGPTYDGPVIVWDIRTAQPLCEIAAGADAVMGIKLAPDGSWVSIHKAGTTEIYEVASGKLLRTIERSFREFCYSNSGQKIAFWEDNRIQFLHPRTNLVWVWQTDAVEALKPLRFNGFHSYSDDDLFLIVHAFSPSNERLLLILDEDDGALAAKIAVPSNTTEIKISRDWKTIAYYADGKLLVRDAEKQEKLLELSSRTWLGWGHTQKNVLVCFRDPRPKEGEAARLESWNVETKERVATWEVPEPPKDPLSRYVQLWHYESGKPVLSPDGGRVLWVTYHHETPALSPWQAKLRNWAKRPTPSGCFYDVHLLDTESLSVAHRWQIPCEWAAHGNVPPVFEWKPIDDRLFVSNTAQTEIWRVPPRSLSQSAGIALMMTWFLGMLCYCFHAWRKRRRATISPIPPPAKLPEVGDA